MPLRLRKETLWGVAASVFVVVLVTGSIAIVWIRRTIHRRQIARIFPVSEGRPRCHPRCHMSLTDDDVARIPGTRRALRNSMQTSRPSRGWTNLSSRENLPKRPLPAFQPPMPTAHGSNTALSWPLSPRLKRSNATPLVKLKVLPLTPINENSMRKPGKSSSSNKAVRVEESLDGNIERDDLEAQENRPSPGSDLFTTVILKPKPLFHNSHRSISTPMITPNSNGHDKSSKTGVDLDLNARYKRGYCLPRSTSLCSQQSGMVPNRPVPPLPFNFSSSTRFERAKSPIESSSKWTSGNSLLSGDTSILDDAGSRVTSQAETDFTSVSAFSPPKLGPNLLAQAVLDDCSIQEFLDSDDIAKVSPSKSGFNSDPGIQKPFRASLVHSLPRSASSGLSMSLLDHGPSWNVSSTSLKIDRPSPRKHNLVVPQTEDRKSMIRRGVSSASPLKNSVLFESQEELKSKRASTSILRVVSGNEGSPLHDKLEKRPSSIATSNPFQWDPPSIKPGIPSALKNQSRGHKRQMDLKIKNVGGSTVRITGIYATNPLEHPSITSQGDATKSPTAARFPADRHSPLRPPSRVTFDPQIKASLPSPPARNSHGTAYSPTLSMVEFYNTTDADSSAPSTPTKIPAAKPSGSNPNRHKTIFSNPGTATWSFLEPSAKFDEATPDPSEYYSNPSLPPPSQSPLIPISSEKEKDKTSFLFPLPPINPTSTTTTTTTTFKKQTPHNQNHHHHHYHHNHPHRQHHPSRTLPTHTRPQIRGPRSPPPSPNHTRRISKPKPSDFHNSIAFIRRANSDAKSWDPDVHARYLNIGIANSRTRSPFLDHQQLQQQTMVVVGGKEKEQEGSSILEQRVEERGGRGAKPQSQAQGRFKFGSVGEMLLNSSPSPTITTTSSSKTHPQLQPNHQPHHQITTNSKRSTTSPTVGGWDLGDEGGVGVGDEGGLEGEVGLYCDMGFLRE